MSKYPAQIDNSITLPAAVDNSTPVDANVFNNVRSAVLQIEAELGVKPSGVSSTVRGRLDSIDTILLNSAKIAGDLGNTAANPYVIGIWGNPISSTTPNLGEVLTWSGIAWIPATPSGGGGGSVIFSGDLSGNSFAQTVIKLQGHAISPIAPIDGYILTWVAGSSDWEPKAAPVGFTAGGDLTGSATNQQVISLTGSAGIVTLAAPITLKQSDLTTNSGTGASLTIQAQNETGTTSIGGNLVLASGTGTSTNGDIYFKVGATDLAGIEGEFGTGTFGGSSATGGANFKASLGPNPGAPTLIGCLWILPGATARTVANAILNVSSSYLAFNTPIAGGSINFTDAGATYISTTTRAAGWSWDADANATFTQGLHATTPHTFTIQAQNVTTGTGSNLILTSGTGSVTAGTTSIQVGAVDKLTLAPTTSDLTSTTQTSITSGTVVLKMFGGASNTSAFQGCNEIYYASTNGVITTALNYVFVDTGVSTMSWSSTTTATMLQADTAVNSAIGKVLTIHAQNATGTTSTGGALVLASGTGTSLSGAISLKAGATTVVNYNSSQVLTLGDSVNTAYITGYASTIAQVNSPSFILGSFSGVPLITETVAAAAVRQWSNICTSVTISQATDATTAHPFTIQAGNTTTGFGSDLNLTSGTGSNADGYTYLKTGGTTRLTVKPTGAIAIANLGIGIVQSDASGNLTSSTATLTGDVSGNTSATVVDKLKGKNLAAALSTIGAAQDGYQLTWVNASSEWQAKPEPADILTLLGDVTGTTAVSVVSKINGATVSSAGGALTTGKVLRVTGASTVDYGAVDLANTSAITGLLPVQNGGNAWHHLIITPFAGTTNTNSGTYVVAGTFELDTTELTAANGTRTIKLRCIGETTSPQMSIKLYNLTTASDVTGSTLTTSSTVPVALTTGDLTANLTNGYAMYQVQILMAAGAGGDRVILDMANIRVDWT